MKIAYIYDAVYPWVKGGAEKRIYEIGKRLSDKGHEVHWYGIGWWFDGNNGRTIDHDGIILHGVCEPMQLYVDGRRSIKEAIYFAEKLLPKLVRERFDVIDCQEFPYFPCFTAKVHSLFRRTSLVITWYEVWGNYWFEYLGKKGIFGYLVERLAIKPPKLIIPISEKIKEDLKTLNVPESRMRVIPNGVDFYRLQSVMPSSEEFDIIYVGRLISHKNVDVLLKALNIVRKEIRDVKCGIIGDGPEMNNLRTLSRKLDLNNNVKFFGFIESDLEVYSHMKSSKIFVLPSSREGFPNTILEANSCGLPAIIVRHEKNAGVGVVKDGYNGFIVNLSPEEIAEKVIYLLQNDEELSRLSRNSVEFAKTYDWSIIVKKLLKVYEEAIG